jgi:hypothetical protein
MSEPLLDPGEHRALAGEQWSDARARDAIAEIAADAATAHAGPVELWPNHPADFDDEAETEAQRPSRSVYLGAAGMAWALHRLAADDLAPELDGLAELVAALPDGYRALPELTELDTGTPPPPPSLLFGESGILLAREAIAGAGTGAGAAADRARADALAACIAANARNRTRELCWGSPGTMIAALAMWRRTGEARWRKLWCDSAAWLLDEWRELVWTQEMYETTTRYVGAGHGFAGNAAVLLDGAELLGERAAPTIARIIASATTLARIEDGADGGPRVAQWPGFADTEIPRVPVQWCHGAPGVVSSLRQLPTDPDIDRLLIAGAELTWQAGPLRKGVGLCHGTAGNAFALLTGFARSGDERWLERARAFAMDAFADVRAWRERHGRGRYTLFTGDVGVALLLRSCLTGDAAFPFLDDALAGGAD